MFSPDIQGYAIRRNNTCSEGEVYCQQTWNTTEACCPKNSFCSNSGEPNTICCPNPLNCTQSIEAEAPTCADKGWNLYNHDGPFCCEADQQGYYILNSILVGCFNGTGDVTGVYQALPVISSGQYDSTRYAWRICESSISDICYMFFRHSIPNSNIYISCGVHINISYYFSRYITYQYRGYSGWCGRWCCRGSRYYRCTLFSHSISEATTPTDTTTCSTVLNQCRELTIERV